MRRQLKGNPLAVANVAFVLAIVLHGADHIRQGTNSVTAEVFWGGAVLAVIGFSTLPLSLRRHPRAPLFAAAVGLWTAVAVSASHLAPHWSAFSNPYPDLSLDALSWTVMLAEIATALIFGLIGVATLRRQAATAGAGAATSRA